MACVPTVPTTIVRPSGARLGDRVGAGVAAGARLVVDQHRLVPGDAQLLADQPRQDVGRAARREGDDDVHRLAGVRRPGRAPRARRRAPATTASEQARRASSAFIAAAFEQDGGRPGDYSAPGHVRGGGFSQSRHHRHSQERDLDPPRSLPFAASSPPPRSSSPSAAANCSSTTRKCRRPSTGASSASRSANSSIATAAPPRAPRSATAPPSTTGSRTSA